MSVLNQPIIPKQNNKMPAKSFRVHSNIKEDDAASFSFWSVRNNTSRGTISSENRWPALKNIPVLRQQYLPASDVIREYETKRWYGYLKDGYIIFIWIYFLGYFSIYFINYLFISFIFS